LLNTNLGFKIVSLSTDIFNWHVKLFLLNQVLN